MQNISRYIFGFIMILGSCSLVSCKKNDKKAETPLTVTNYFPNSGSGGTLVTIKGTGFSAEGKVSFEGTDAVVVAQNDSVLVVRAPQEGKTGQVVYAANSKTINIGNYTYQALSLTSFAPKNGPAGMHVRISGAGFSSLKSPAEVTLNGKPATVVSVSDTLLVAEVPEGAGSGAIVVKVDGKSSTGDIFKFQAVNTMKPITGAGGTRVVIKGDGFDADPAKNFVEFNGRPATVVAASLTELVVTVPVEVTTGPLSVTVGGQRTPGPTFTKVPPPTIDGVTPLSGPAGQEMTITGLNFSTTADENVVKINNIAFPVKSATSNKLVLSIPAGIGTGKLQLSVNDQLVQGPEIKEQNLGIVSAVPSMGLAGTKVTITGVGFSTNPAENEVTFNGSKAVIESATENMLVVVAPSDLTSGALKVKRATLEAFAPSRFLRAGIMTLAGGPTTSLPADLDALVVDSKGNVFVTANRTSCIYKITPTGSFSLYAGAPGQMGYVNGPVAESRFVQLNGICIDAQDNLYVSEVGNGNNIRMITPGGIVSTLRTGMSSNPGRIMVDKDNNLYLTQTYAGVLKILPSGNTVRAYNRTASDNSRPVLDNLCNLYVTGDDYEAYIGIAPISGNIRYDFIGSSEPGFVDGPFNIAKVSYGVSGMVRAADGTILIMDRNNFAIRRMDINKQEMSTVLKVSSTRGYQDGAFENARWWNPNDIALDKDGNIYVVDGNNRAVRKIFLQ
ncbi:IPT/TIG domain-containing protein [Chitinophaga skermanii]|uniref:IPT/TIG domain-containing protein n=1 Tax=Chitinophaga skermanii TaxID=331697 RepID=A0A327QZ81_9BACT|nr:IPT/TIG domain-containing protein [Chitinophaga skermanii]RAJ08733.1 IPT/TIG domain-containing protein [Chitinophaga skermanii]